MRCECKAGHYSLAVPQEVQFIFNKLLIKTRGDAFKKLGHKSVPK